MSSMMRQEEREYARACRFIDGRASAQARRAAEAARRTFTVVDVATGAKIASSVSAQAAYDAACDADGRGTDVNIIDDTAGKATDGVAMGIEL